MTTTYSVIIQNKKTMDTFLKYQPLFMEALNNNRIGVCKWIESGTTIDTAIPEISELTNDKEEWRAIIVRFEDDHLMSGFESDKRNPFDFAVNKSLDDNVEESEVPLIRLTQMLGGVPAPEMKFECEQIVEEHKAPRTIYKPVINSERDEAYKRLCKKYEYDGKLPSSIIIISIREGYVEQDSINSAWSSHRESNSSEFWKRNKYPSNCRFLVYDFDKQGPVQRNADEFGFWFSTLLLSTNETDSGTLQAYRLYNFKTDFDRSLMGDTFQTVVNRLYSAKLAIEKDIKRDIEHQLVTDDTLPKYKMEIPVPIKLPKDSSCTVSMKGFGLFSEGANSDIAKWAGRKKEAEEKLADSVRKAERSLDQTADRMRSLCSFSEEEVVGLDKYQVEDLTRETNQLYSDIVEIQGHLPTEDVTANPKILEASKDIKQYLKGRVRSSSAFALIGLVVLLIIVCHIPALINHFSHEQGSIWHILIAICIESIIVVGFSLLALLWQKIKLNGLLHVYNTYIKAAFNKITDNASEYSRYLSNIASHQRGHSYLALSKRKKYKVGNAHYAKYKHIKAIDIFLSKLKAWSTAYHLKTDFVSPIIDEDATVDVFLSPTKNGMYTFETSSSYAVPVNNSGETVESPFCFAEKLEIVREELYDDNY